PHEIVIPTGAPVLFLARDFRARGRAVEGPWRDRRAIVNRCEQQAATTSSLALRRYFAASLRHYFSLLLLAQRFYQSQLPHLPPRIQPHQPRPSLRHRRPIRPPRRPPLL